jgi:hypothetical protein
MAFSSSLEMATKGGKLYIDLKLMSLVTIQTAFNPADAQLVRSRLDAAGFHPVVAHELSALSLDGYALAAGGILVQVPAEEAEEAKEFLTSSRPMDEGDQHQID